VLAVVLLSGYQHQYAKTMTTSIIYRTQGIRGFHYKKTIRKDQTEFYHITSTATEAGYALAAGPSMPSSLRLLSIALFAGCLQA